MNNQKGFTLVEIICVLLIVSILVATAAMRFIDLAPNAERKIIEAVASEMNSQEHMAWLNCRLQEGCVDYVRPGFMDLQGMTFNNTDNTITFQGGGTHQLYEWYSNNAAIRWDTTEQITTDPVPDPVCKDGFEWNESKGKCTKIKK